MGREHHHTDQERPGAGKLKEKSNGIRMMRANLEWVENIITQIKNGQVPEN